MADSNKLLIARNALSLTQKELGLKVALLTTGKSISDQYAQKKVSLWESGTSRPTPQEMAALSEILRRPESEIDAWFGRAPSSAEELFTQLADSQLPSLIVSCYSGKPRLTNDPRAWSALIAGLKANVFLAMIFPYPADFEEPDQPDDDFERLRHFYKDVWYAVEQHFRQLSMDLPPEKRERIKLYRPKLKGKANVLFPPVGNSRFTEVLQFTSETQLARTLYSWVETEQGDGFYRIGSFASGDIHASQLAVWDSYFGFVTKTWTRAQSLPADTATNWERYSPEVL
jgi:transcriptional regulator with XRE-family HTH domain